MKELNAIIEYENARRSIIEAKEMIASAMSFPCLDPIESDQLFNPSCLTELYEHNRYVRIFNECDGVMYEGEHEQDMEPYGEAPTLCENCKNLDEKIQLRKFCKKRFGTAKRRLSAIARQHLTIAN